MLLALCACSLDYGEAKVEETLRAETPETVLLDFTHTIVSGDVVAAVLKAQRAETYGKKKEIVLSEVYYSEYDQEGKLATEGWADQARFNTESEDAEVRGSIIIYSHTEKSALYAESLSWSKNGKRLKAGAEETVLLKKDDGSYVEGKGFEADFRENRLSFSAAVRGRYEAKKEE